MPGTPSGENHSSESHACGRNRMPRLSSSMYRRRIWRLSAERSMESFRSQKRSDSSFSSGRRVQGSARWRSEEHTSELQSQSNLVCRLLLEKKKKRYVCYCPQCTTDGTST